MKFLTDNIIPFLKKQLPSNSALQKLNDMPAIKTIGDNLSLSSSGYLSAKPGVERIDGGVALSNLSSGTATISLYGSILTSYSKVELILKGNCASSVTEAQFNQYFINNSNLSIADFWNGIKINYINNDSNPGISYVYKNPAGETDLHLYWKSSPDTPFYAKYTLYPPTSATVLNIPFEAELSSYPVRAAITYNLPIQFRVAGYLSTDLNSLNKLYVNVPATKYGLRYTLLGYRL